MDQGRLPLVFNCARSPLTGALSPFLRQRWSTRVRTAAWYAADPGNPLLLRTRPRTIKVDTFWRTGQNLYAFAKVLLRCGTIGRRQCTCPPDLGTRANPCNKVRGINSDT